MAALRACLDHRQARGHPSQMQARSCAHAWPAIQQPGVPGTTNCIIHTASVCTAWQDPSWKVIAMLVVRLRIVHSRLVPILLRNPIMHSIPVEVHLDGVIILCRQGTASAQPPLAQHRVAVLDVAGEGSAVERVADRLEPSPHRRRHARYVRCVKHLRAARARPCGLSLVGRAGGTTDCCRWLTRQMHVRRTW